MKSNSTEGFVFSSSRLRCSRMRVSCTYLRSSHHYMSCGIASSFVCWTSESYAAASEYLTHAMVRSLQGPCWRQFYIFVIITPSKD